MKSLICACVLICVGPASIAAPADTATSFVVADAGHPPKNPHRKGKKKDGASVSIGTGGASVRVRNDGNSVRVGPNGTSLTVRPGDGNGRVTIGPSGHFRIGF